MHLQAKQPCHPQYPFSHLNYPSTINLINNQYVFTAILDKQRNVHTVPFLFSFLKLLFLLNAKIYGLKNLPDTAPTM